VLRQGGPPAAHVATPLLSSHKFTRKYQSGVYGNQRLTAAVVAAESAAGADSGPALCFATPHQQQMTLGGFLDLMHSSTADEASGTIPYLSVSPFPGVTQNGSFFHVSPKQCLQTYLVSAPTCYLKIDWIYLM
jgi:hypothetical protein